MAASLTTAAANAMADALDDYINTGGVGKIIIYDGTPPANAGASLVSNNALVTFDASNGPVLNPMFGAASSGTITLSGTPLTAAASLSGTASFFRIYKNDGTTVVAQGSVSTTGAQLNLNTVSITSSVNVTITSGTITMPTAGS